MKSLTSLITILAALSFATAANAGSILTDWTATTATSATGDVDGHLVTVTSSTSAPIMGIVGGVFAGSNWEGGDALSNDDLSIVAANVNAGDFQEFNFATPMGGFLYVENFDASSIANITATGATSLSLVSHSPSILFDSTGADTGIMTSANTSYNGEGDAILAFTGPVTSLRLDYTSGDGANGVFYTIAHEACPEPSTACLALLGGLGALATMRRRQRV